MVDLYWIVTLGSLGCVFTIFTVIGLIAVSIMVIMYMTTIDSTDPDNKSIHEFTSKHLVKIVVVWLICLMGSIFIPSKRDLYTIYGIGTIIDYAKGSKEVQKLPDNAVKCLNIWLEEHSDTTSNKQKYE